MRVPLPAAMITTSTACVMLVPPLIESCVMFCSKTSSFSRLLRIICALLVPMVLGACSAVRIGYGNAPSLLYWWLDGYVDFDESQSVKARAALDTLHAWHARHELPAYIKLLQDLQAVAGADVTPQQACVQWDAARERLRALLTHAEPGIAALVPTVKPPQIEHIQRQLEKRNAAWREKWLDATPQQRREHRFSQTVERYESFYGTLEERQLAVIRDNVAKSRFDPNLRYQETQRRQQEALLSLRQLLASANPEAGAAAAVREVIERALRSPDPTTRARFEADLQDSCRAMAELHNSTTATQRRRAITVLKGYEDDLRALLPTPR